MKKLSLIVLILALFSIIFAACGSGDNATSEDKITIKIYYPTPDKVELRAIEDDKIARFEAAYPNVKVVRDEWQYNVDQIGIKMAANEAPTFFNTFATEAKFLVDSGWAADITDLWNKYEYKDQINPVLQKQFMIDGKVYGVAQKGYVTTTIVNKKMLEDKGVPVPSYDWTWDDMLNTAKAVADPSAGIAGIALMGKGNDAGWNWTNFLFEAGGDIQKVENGKVTAAFNSEAGLKALDFYRQLKEENTIPQDWALGWGDAVGAFAQGRAAMVIAGAEGPLDQALNQGGMKPEDVLTFPMPAAEAGGKHTGVLGGDYLVINPNATPAEQEAAFNYIVFDYFSDEGLASLEENIKQFQKDGKYYVPPHMDYYTVDSEYGRKVRAVLDKYDNVYKYNAESNALLDGKPEAQFNTQDYYATMTTAIQKVFTGESNDLKAILDEAAQTVQKDFFDKIEAKK
jgi:ABC-type glycerol-3-phosphate transport system substrate-binding protein